jgi:addiction module HigA family antidote
MKRMRIHQAPDVMMPFPPLPGEMLLEEFLKPRGMSQTALARAMGVPLQVVNGIVQGRRAITARSAILLSHVFNNTPHYWMALQAA